MNRSEDLARLLKSLSTSSPEIEAAAIVDIDGFTIASSLPGNVEGDLFAAMTASLLGTSEQIVHELNRGACELALLRSGMGYVILSRCGRESILTLLTSSSAKLGLIFLDVERITREVAQVLD